MGCRRAKVDLVRAEGLLPPHTPTEGRMPQRLQDSGHFQCRPIEIGCRCQKLRRCTHSPAPPKGHIRHQARPAPTIITTTAQNQTYQVMAVEKLREGTATPMRPVAITNQKMIWLGRIAANWKRRLF